MGILMGIFKGWKRWRGAPIKHIQCIIISLTCFYLFG